MIFYRVRDEVISESGVHLMFNLPDPNKKLVGQVVDYLKTKETVRRVSGNDNGTVFITTNPHIEYYDVPATTKSQYFLAEKYFNKLITDTLEVWKTFGSDMITYEIGVTVESISGLKYTYCVHFPKEDHDYVLTQLSNKDWVSRTFSSTTGTIEVTIMKSIIFYRDDKRLPFDTKLAERFILLEVSRILAEKE